MLLLLLIYLFVILLMLFFSDFSVTDVADSDVAVVPGNIVADIAVA